MKIFSHIIIISLSILLTRIAAASPITFEYTGAVTYTSAFPGNPNPFTGLFYSGQTFSGRITFDSDAIGTITDIDSISYANAIISYYIEFEGGLYADFHTGYIGEVDNRHTELPDEIAYVDTYSVVAGNKTYDSNPPDVASNISVTGYRMAGSYMNFEDYTGSMLSGFSLPLVPPDISATNNFFSMEFRLLSGSAPAYVDGTIYTLTAVPLPGAAILFISGLSSFCGICFFRKGSYR